MPKAAPIERVRKTFAKMAPVDATSAALAQDGALLVKKKRRRQRGAVRVGEAQARALELRVWNLLSQGRTTSGIARALDLTQSGVAGIIRRVERRYEEMVVASVGLMKARQARILERIADEAMDGWDRSQKAAQKIVTEEGTVPTKGGEDGEIDIKKTTVERRDGDPRFLAEARAALADLRDIYGLNAPKKPDESAGDRNATYIVAFGNDAVPAAAPEQRAIDVQTKRIADENDGNVEVDDGEGPKLDANSLPPDLDDEN